MKCTVCEMAIPEGHEFFTFPAGTGIHKSTSDCVKLLLVDNKRLKEQRDKSEVELKYWKHQYSNKWEECESILKEKEDLCKKNQH